MNYAHIVTEFRNRAWAVNADTFGSMLELVAKWARGEKFSEQEVGVRIREANIRNGVNRGEADIYHEPLLLSGRSPGGGSGSRGGSSGSVALIPILGVISHRANMLTSISSSGGTSVEQLTSQFRQAVSHPGVKAIVLDVDSPGGSVDGVFELAQEIYNARGRKKIVACANSLAASAAYAIAAAASELVIAPSGQVGSIGVFSSHEDHSKELERAGVKVTIVSAGRFKTEGNPLEALSESARAEMQDKVDHFYQMFVAAVAASRGDSQANVRAGYGQGRCVTAVDSVRANLADRIGTLDDVLQKLGVHRLGGAAAAEPRDDARLVGDHADAPDLVIAIGRQRRQLQLDLLQMGVSTPPDRAQAPENYLDAMQRRRRQLRRLSLETGMPVQRSAGDEARAASHRRRKFELET